ncbi:hypothetical protein [Nocardia sp. NPDC051570]|uniref:hypothetical protein n=1 Tax=Nocardia sp. NPDC051570 TaxID=3364324 RepID=UPI00378BECE6
MSTTRVLDVVASLAATGLWPLLILATAVVTVTAIALCRADRCDIPKIFTAFAASFGFRGLAGADDDDAADVEGRAALEDRKQDNPEELE